MDGTLAKYNALDVLSTRLLWEPLCDEAREAGVWQYYCDRVLPLQRAVMRMQARGLLVDKKAKAELTKQYETQAKSLRKQLPAELDPNSAASTRKWVYTTLGLPPTVKRTKFGGQLSVDEETLHALYMQHGTPELQILLAYREATKIASTYLRGLRIDPDGRVRSQWLVHGTATGRLASRKPNLQNVPGVVRIIYVAPNGRWFGSLDYDQIELRLMAHLAQDERLQQAFAEGTDVHGLNAMDLFGLDKPASKASKRTKPYRDFAKVFVYGVIMYGGSPRTVKLDPALLALVPDGRRGVQKLAENFFQQHPAILAWRKRIAEEVRQHGRLYNWEGRLRIFMGHDHDRIKAGWNFPIQSGAASRINQAFLVVEATIPEERAMVVAQHHDALLLETSGLPVLYEIREIMEAPVTIDGRSIQIPVELTMGQRWGRLLPPPTEKRYGR